MVGAPRWILATTVVFGTLSGCHSSDDSFPKQKPGAAPALSEKQSGEGTWYDADGSGNCSFDPSPSNLDVAAMNDSQYAGSSVCGECVDVTGPNGAVTVRIVDRCPGCSTGDLDLSKEAFAQIA